MEYILALDQGTHASRALLLDQDGQVLARSLHPVALAHPQPGHVEQDAEQLVSSLQAAIEDVLHTLTGTQRNAIRACGISTQRSTVLAWQHNGVVQSDAISWQDTRGAPQTEALHKHADDIRKLSGLPLSPHYGASKLHWLHQLLGNDPQLHIGPLAAFLLHRLCGADSCAVDHSNAQRMQLLDIRRLAWSRQLASWFEVPLDRLPPCRPVQHDYGVLSDHGIPVTALCGDQNAAWFGTGAQAQDSALVNLGSGAFILAAQTGTAPAALLTSIARSDARPSCDYLLEGTVNGAGNALHWLQQQYPQEDIKTNLADWLEQVSNPPLFMNTVGGLGSPWWQQGPQPAFLPEDDSASVAERAVAVAESILFLVQYNLERIQQRQPLTRLRVSGGLSRVDALCRKLANLSGLSVQRVEDAETSALGVAWLAAGGPSHWHITEEVQQFEPQTDTGLQARYTRFIEQLQQRLNNDT